MRHQYSLKRRLVATVLIIEIALALGISGATLIYTRHEQFRAFDLMLHGRAESLLGSVQAAEDATDGANVDLHALDLRRGDFWQVLGGKGEVLAQSANWTVAFRGAIIQSQNHDFHIQYGSYRGIVLHGVRQLDADDGGAGILRPVTIYYAASLQRVHEAMKRASLFLICTNGILLVITGAGLITLLKRGLAPLDHLNRAAAQVNPSEPLFRTPQDVARTYELCALATTLESATKHLNDNFRQQQTFLHDAAHELKTAVTIIKTSLQLLAIHPRSIEEYHSGLELCMTDCGRMEDLVQRMLLLARLEQRSAPGHSVCNLAESSVAVISQFTSMATAAQVALELEANQEAWVAVEQDSAATLLFNLVVNALQHTPSGGAVWIRVQPESEQVRVQIEDQGEGIAPEDIIHVFDRFYRGDPSRSRNTGGTGLGLAICKAIVEGCGGTIDVRSQPGKELVWKFFYLRYNPTLRPRYLRRLRRHVCVDEP